jgi:hypothetical protein
LAPLPHPEEQLRVLAWYGLAIVVGYLFAVSVILRWHPRRTVRMPRYQPPSEVSPAVACYLREGGATEKPVAVALVNMAAKGSVRIEQGPKDYLITQADASVALEPEEQTIADALFHGRGHATCLADVPQPRLEQMARAVHACLESIAEPDLISSHFAWLVPALTLSFWCVLATLYADGDDLRNSQFGGTIVVPGLVGVWAMLATIRTLPATFYKLKSHLPGRTALPLDRTDWKVFYFLLTALAAWAAFAGLSSWPLALQLESFLLVNLLGAVTLRAPTRAGYDLLEQVDDFRMFLDEVDADRVNRVTAPDAPAPSPEQSRAWALALGVEHSWGEQFAAALLNRLGAGSAMASIEDNMPEERRAGAEILDLRLK